MVGAARGPLITVDENTTLSGDAPVLRALAEAGVGVGLDGYGSDSASLVRFRGLPFTELRLDGTLVAAAGREGSRPRRFATSSTSPTPSSSPSSPPGSTTRGHEPRSSASAATRRRAGSGGNPSPPVR